MRKSANKPVLCKRYDIQGNALPRIIGHWVRIKTSIMGNYNSGPGLRCLLTLWMLHYFGKPMFMLRTWLKNQYGLKARVRGLLNRLKR